MALADSCVPYHIIPRISVKDAAHEEKSDLIPRCTAPVLSVVARSVGFNRYNLSMPIPLRHSPHETVAFRIATEFRQGHPARIDSATVATICSWVPTRRDLSLVAGDDADHLAPALLAAWIRRSLVAIVLRRDVDGEAVAFCTLTRAESPLLPSQTVELCHLITDPNARPRLAVFNLLDAAKHSARRMGFTEVVGRVVPANTRMLVIAAFKGGFRLEPLPNWAAPGFVWLAGPTEESGRLPTR